MARASQSGVIVTFSQEGAITYPISNALSSILAKKKARRGNTWLHMGVMNLPKMATHHYLEFITQ